MRKDVRLLKDCCTSYHLVKEICEVIRAHIAHPLMLASYVTALSLVLYEETMLKKYIKYVNEALRWQEDE